MLHVHCIFLPYTKHCIDTALIQQAHKGWRSPKVRLLHPHGSLPARGPEVRTGPLRKLYRALRTCALQRCGAPWKRNRQSVAIYATYRTTLRFMRPGRGWYWMLRTMNDKKVNGSSTHRWGGHAGTQAAVIRNRRYFAKRIRCNRAPRTSRNSCAD